jgi:hypothetical protein
MLQYTMFNRNSFTLYYHQCPIPQLLARNYSNLKYKISGHRGLKAKQKKKERKEGRKKEPAT